MIKIDAVLYGLKGANWKQAYHSLAESVSDATGLSMMDVADQLIANEQKSPSGIGRGFALPHLQIAGLSKPFVLFAKLAQPIDMETVDHDAVDMMAVLLSPENDGPYHLRRLSRLSRFFRDETICQKLQGAESEDALRAILLYEIDMANEERKAA